MWPMQSKNQSLTSKNLSYNNVFLELVKCQMILKNNVIYSETLDILYNLP